MLRDRGEQLNLLKLELMQFTFTNLAVWLSQSDEDIGELSAF